MSWFNEDNGLHTCSNCRYGNLDYHNKACAVCLEINAYTERPYTQWECEVKSRRDKFVFWYSRIGKKFACSRAALLVDKIRETLHLQF